MQKLVARKTALANEAKEAMWLKGTYELGFGEKNAEIFCESQSAICLAKNNVYHERTKHMAVSLSFLRGLVEYEEAIVKKIGTLENPADIPTKAVPMKKFEVALDRLEFSAIDFSLEKRRAGSFLVGIESEKGLGFEDSEVFGDLILTWLKMKVKGENVICGFRLELMDQGSFLFIGLVVKGPSLLHKV